MGVLSKKSKQTSKPWKQAQPYILNSLSQTQSTFDENQPRLQDMSATAYDAFKQAAPNAFGPSPLLQNARGMSQRFASGEMSGQNPADSYYRGLLSSRPTNEAMNGARDLSGGGFVGQGDAAGYFRDVMGGRSNDAFNEVLGDTLDDVENRVNSRFAQRNVGFGRSSIQAGALGRELGRTSAAMRSQNFENDQARRMQAAGMLDGATRGDRAQQLQALGLLGQLDESGQGRQMQAAGLLGQNYENDMARQMQAIGMAPQLRLAEFAGYGPALGLLSSAASIPYQGVEALTGLTRQSSAGYGTQTSNPGFLEYMQAFGNNAAHAASMGG